MKFKGNSADFVPFSETFLALQHPALGRSALGLIPNTQLCRPERHGNIIVQQSVRGWSEAQRLVEFPSFKISIGHQQNNSLDAWLFQGKIGGSPHTCLGPSFLSFLWNGIDDPQGGNHFVWIQLRFTKTDTTMRQKPVFGSHHERGRRTIFRTTRFERSHPPHGRIDG